MSEPIGEERAFQVYLKDNFPEFVGDDRMFLAMRGSFFAGYTLQKMEKYPELYFGWGQ